jgi:hypothetical protein
MRIVVMGAGGEMGQVAARHLVRNQRIDELVLADRSVDDAERAAATIDAGGSVTTVDCDLLDPRRTREVLDAADAVLNCAGPFFLLGVPTLEAAIDTATTYVDICDDPEPTIEMLALDERARAAGVTAVIGMGASPGLSNLLAARAAERLDSVQDCITGWSLSESRDDEAPAPQRQEVTGAVVHFMEQIHGHVAIVEDGELVHRPPLRAVEIDYPGHGRGTGYVVGHPEPVTLHRSFGVTGRSCNVVLVDDGPTAGLLGTLQRDLDNGCLDLRAAGREALAPSATRLARAMVAGARLRSRGSLPSLFAWVRGTTAGRSATVGCHVTTLPPGMAGATSVPAALAVGQLLDARPAPGVHAPERVIDATRLLTELIPFCVTPVADVDALAPVDIRFDV